MKKVLIVEDDVLVRNELAKLLGNAGYIAEILEDFDNSLTKILSIAPDLVLIDINIPRINGTSLLKELRKSSNIPVIMVTSQNTEIDEVLSMSYGADDFVAKPYNPTILLLRIAAVLKRYDKRENIVSYGNLKYDRNKGEVLDKTRKIVLTKNENLIFAYLLENKERIVKRDELMIELWNNDECINDNALTVNISRLREKLKKLTGETSIETRKGVGYILK